MAQQQSDYRFTFTTAVGNFDLVSFNLTESLSTPFSLDVILARMNEEPVDFAGILDDSATLVFWKGDKPIRFVNGIVRFFQQTESGVRRTHYSAIIQPSYVRTHLGSTLRSFQQKTVPDIISQVLTENGITAVRFELSGVHEIREYCVQYRETHQNFIERLAAEEGLFYYFEHTENTHTLVWCDDTLKLVNLGQVLHNPNISASRTEPSLWGFSYQEKIATAQHKLKDYSFKNPDYGQEHKAQAANAGNQHQSYQKYDYPGRYKKDAAGKPFNQHRLEFERRDTQIAQADSDDLRLIAGKHITLSKPPSANDNTNWYIVSAKHHGGQPQSLQEDSAGSGGSIYSNTLQLIPQGHAWRATPQHKPKVDGPQIARVTGPQGEEIYCDEHGRVKLQFPWDLEGQYDDLSSCWVRVSQGWAGLSWGAIAIPRIGQEVIVSFLEGDPDQPIITGRTYHAYNKPPYPLPANKTRMSIKSKSHKAKGFNELRFEDEAGQEQLFIHGQKDQDIRVLNDTREWIGNDRHLITQQDQFELVEGNKHSTISKDRYQQIDGNQHLSIQGHQNDNISGSSSRIISQDLQEKVGMKYATETGSEVHFNAGINAVLEAGASITLKVGGSFININPSGIFINGSAVTLNAGGAPTVGTGSQPTQATPPRQAAEADDAKPGWKAVPPPPVTAPEAPLIEADTVIKIDWGVKAVALRIDSGKPFCTTCFLKGKG
jgi:type VI secretion system secreted protein VgrG